MEFHQLRYFIAAAEELSITAAAKRVHVSQPALSRQIAALEDEVGVALFDRIRKRIYLTDAGRFFLPRARQILCDAETSTQLIREQFGKAKRTLRAGFQNPFLDDIIAPAVKSLRKSTPRLKVELFELEPRAQLDRLRDGELDLAIVGNLVEKDRERFATRRLMKNRMAAVLPDDHPLAGRKQIPLKLLAEDSHISLSDAIFPGRRKFITEICQAQGFDPAIVAECNSIPLLLGEVSTGSGVALLPRHCEKLPHAGCVFVKLQSPVVYAEIIAVFREEEQSGVLSKLLTNLQSAADAIVE